MCNDGIGIDFDLSKRLWFQWLMQDAAYAHPILFCISASHCVLAQKPLGKIEFHHLGKTLTFLKERLSDNALSAHMSTVCMIMSLVLVFSSLGEHTTARVHMKPLVEMARLLGGAGTVTYQSCAKVYLKVVRLVSLFQESRPENNKIMYCMSSFDLAYSLHCGEMPIFLPTFVPDPSADLCSAQPEIYMQNLLAIFKDLQQLATELNDQDGNPEQLLATKFQNPICMLQYRLWALQGKLACHDNNMAESLRLAMLALLGSTFRVNGINVRYTYLENALRGCCAAIEPSVPPVYPQDLMSWILMVGAISAHAFDETSHAWLLALWRAENGRMYDTMGWGEMRRRLRNIAWIDSIHDQPGRQAFYVLSSQEDREAAARSD